jgi:hypothetical protein
MAIDRASNPYDASGWTGEVELVESQVELLIGDESVRILPADPRRIWYVLCVLPAGTTWRVWPRALGDSLGISPDFGKESILIHNASYPSLVQGEWYFNSVGGGHIIRIIEGRDMY